jgi:hypothetical protein
MLYDAFICHATEDKDGFVRPLAELLSKYHLHIWYDEFSLSVGDSLRQAIDTGLSKSRFGIVVLSPDFFRKGWAQRELDGLVARQINERRRLILPIWHNVGVEEILEYSPPLADTVAISSSRDLHEICRELAKKLRPDESPLIAAREELIRHGVEPPIISDEWWLDIIEASNRIPNGGAYIPPESTWGGWTFPLPHPSSRGRERGLNLAWTAMQVEWSEFADKNQICQITEPDRVHEFIAEFPGLCELCREFPNYLCFYAPQLTIPEFSGQFSLAFDVALKKSVQECKGRRDANSKYGSALTIDGLSPLCDKEWSLRHESFGNYQATSIASFYVLGEMFSPKVQSFEKFEYLVWLLSTNSRWLPARHREVLIDGMAEWALWPFDTQGTNAFLDALFRSQTIKTFQFSNRVKRALEGMIEDALNNLHVKDSSSRLLDEFISRKIVERYYKFQKQRTERRKRSPVRS